MVRFDSLPYLSPRLLGTFLPKHSLQPFFCNLPTSIPSQYKISLLDQTRLRMLNLVISSKTFFKIGYSFCR